MGGTRSSASSGASVGGTIPSPDDLRGLEIESKIDWDRSLGRGTADKMKSFLRSQGLPNVHRGEGRYGDPTVTVWSTREKIEAALGMTSSRVPLDQNVEVMRGRRPRADELRIGELPGGRSIAYMTPFEDYQYTRVGTPKPEAGTSGWRLEIHPRGRGT